VVVLHMHNHTAHFRFIARERYGGVRRLRRAINRELQLFADELAIDLVAMPGVDGWSTEDRRMLAGVITETIIRMVAELLEVGPTRSRRSSSAPSASCASSAWASRPGTDSLTHVAYESGQHADGTQMLRSFFATSEPISFHRRHLRWHLALHLLASGDDKGARELWRVALAPGTVPTKLGAVEDGAGLLWRWYLYGNEEWQLPWPELGDLARDIAQLPMTPLPAACAAVVLAALGDDVALGRLLSSADSLAAAGWPVPTRVLHGVAAAATASFAGAWGEVADALLPVQGGFSLLGGSRAQRELFEDALLFGLIRAGRGDEAMPLLEVRLERRPSDRESRLLDLVR
jgi:hypothetical protein